MNKIGDNTTFTDQGKDLVKTLTSNVGPSIDKVTGKAQAMGQARQGHDRRCDSASARHCSRRDRQADEVHKEKSGQGFAYRGSLRRVVGGACRGALAFSRLDAISASATIS
jgi:hypothetical protein